MATVEECAQAFDALAARLAGVDEQTRKRNALDRSLACDLTDLGVIFGGRLKDGLLEDIHQVDTSHGKPAKAQVTLTMSSDDLVKMVAGDLNLGSAWAGGRIKIDARVFDLIKLRSIF